MINIFLLSTLLVFVSVINANPTTRSTTPQPKNETIVAKVESTETPNAEIDAGTDNSGTRINWGLCPQLEPSEEEKTKKTAVITECIEKVLLDKNITNDSIESQRQSVATCALKDEGWFDKIGLYKFDKAEREIRNKKLSREIEQQILIYHQQCRSEAEQRFPNFSRQIIAQIQLYQACMDFFISEVCGIEVEFTSQSFNH